MILSDKKYVDPTLVLQSIVDEYGKFIPIGFFFFFFQANKGIKKILENLIFISLHE